MGYPVNSPGELPASLVTTAIRNLSSTRQEISLPSGAKWISVSYRLLPGATATASQVARIVLNASSDADADGKLATPGSYIPIYQGDDLKFSAQAKSLITRMDTLTELPVGSEVTEMRILAGI